MHAVYTLVLVTLIWCYCCRDVNISHYQSFSGLLSNTKCTEGSDACGKCESEDVIVFSRKETWSSNRVKVYSKVDLWFARYGFCDVLSSLGEFVVCDKSVARQTA